MPISLDELQGVPEATRLALRTARQCCLSSRGSDATFAVKRDILDDLKAIISFPRYASPEACRCIFPVPCVRLAPGGTAPDRWPGSRPLQTSPRRRAGHREHPINDRTRRSGEHWNARQGDLRLLREAVQDALQAHASRRYSDRRRIQRQSVLD